MATSGVPLRKQKEYDWKDSNVELIGTDEDRAVKKESALTEAAWQPVTKCNSPSLFVWRIEKFKVVPWPKQDYGKFFSGDSYIILNVYKNPESPALYYDAHFWIGQHSTQDEYGTAAYKTVELDTLLDDKAIQHREVQEYESELFKSYFKTLTYMTGGCESGFRHVKTHEWKPRLFHVSGDKAAKIVVREVETSKNILNSGDVFILDMGTRTIQWNGESSSKDERFSARQYINGLSEERNGKLKTDVIEETDKDCPEFYNELDDQDATMQFKSKTSAKHSKTLYRLSDESGTLKFSEEAKGDFNRSNLDENDVFIIDNGEVVYVYVGQNASFAEKKNALNYAHMYLKDTAYPFVPVTVVNKNVEGPNRKNFDATLNGH